MKRVFIFLLPVVLLIACDPNRVFEENKEIPDYQWAQNNIVAFDVDIQDTLSLHNFYINIRHVDNYPFRNVFLFVKTTFPNNKFKRDTVEIMLQDKNGWRGDGLGDIWDLQEPFQLKKRFPLKGKYKFEFQQAMYPQSLPGIMDVGFRIEKAE